METLDVLLQQELYYQTNPPSSSSTPEQDTISRECRSAMATWCDQCVDFCKFGREPVEITLNYMDRFVVTKKGQETITDRASYQLATMSALYAAIKIHQPEALSAETVAALSRGRYTKEQIEDMERTLLQALEWRLHPVTSMSFVRQYLALFPKDFWPTATAAARDCDAMDDSMEDDDDATLGEPHANDRDMLSSITELAKIQTQLAVRDASFLGVPPSVIAYGALLNGLESMNALDPQTLKAVSTVLAQSMGRRCDHDIEQLHSVQRRLYTAVLNLSSPSSKGLSSSTTTTSSTANDITTRRRPLAACTNSGNGSTSPTAACRKRRLSETASPRTAAASL